MNGCFCKDLWWALYLFYLFFLICVCFSLVIQTCEVHWVGRLLFPLDSVLRGEVAFLVREAKELLYWAGSPQLKQRVQWGAERQVSVVTQIFSGARGHCSSLQLKKLLRCLEARTHLWGHRGQDKSCVQDLVILSCLTCLFWAVFPWEFNFQALFSNIRLDFFCVCVCV